MLHVLVSLQEKPGLEAAEESNAERFVGVPAMNKPVLSLLKGKASFLLKKLHERASFL
jgi:hypothetical protein